MKYFILTLFFSTICFYSNAQIQLLGTDAHKHTTQEDAHAPAATNYRIISALGFDYDSGIWELEDSLSLAYSGNRGGDLIIDKEIASKIDYDEQVAFSWDGFIYTPTSKLLQSFNSNDQITELKVQDYNGGVWVNNRLTVRTYNSADQLKTVVIKNYTSGSWENSSRTVYTYNNGKVKTEIDQSWNGTDWEDNRRTVYSYDGGQLKTEIDQDWNGTDWENEDRTTYAYDSDGNIVQELEEEWSGGVWVKDSRDVKQYNKGWLTSVTDQDWDGSQWMNVDRELYSHINGDYYYNEIVYQDYSSGNWVNDDKDKFTFTSFNKIAQYTTYDWDGTIWEGDFRQIFGYEEYEDGTTATETATSPGIKVYPNPASDYINFINNSSAETMNVDIYNVKGQLMKTLEGAGDLKWHIAPHLSNGIYNYVITIGKKQQSGQLIVR